MDLHQRFSHTILPVTHDVGEAVALSDRIIVMDKNPGRILEVMDVKLPRPRKREDLDFISFQRRLYRLLQGKFGIWRVEFRMALENSFSHSEFNKCNGISTFSLFSIFLTESRSRFIS